MLKVAFIGYGSMGSMLVSSFIRSGALSPDQIIVSTRTKGRLDQLKSRYGGIAIAGDNIEAARQADYIFLCTKAMDFKDILNEIKSCLDPSKVIISIAGAVRIEHIEELTPAKVIKLIPSITSESLAGISLLCYGERVTGDNKAFVGSILDKISTVKIVSEEDLGLATELTSCMPGFIAAMFKELADSAKRRESGLTGEEVDEMVTTTLYGTAKLLCESGLSFEETLARVATKGGITEEGAKVLKSRLPAVFEEMLDVTLDKRKRVNEKVHDQFENS